jgi:hypothetical protein
MVRPKWEMARMSSDLWKMKRKKESLAMSLAIKGGIGPGPSSSQISPGVGLSPQQGS